MSEEKISDEDFFDIQDEEKADLNAIARKVKEIEELDLSIDLLNADLSVRSAARTEITHKQLPVLMLEIGIEEVKMLDYSVKLEHVMGGWPKDPDDRVHSIEVFEPLGIEEIIKTSFGIQATPGSLEAEALKLLLGVNLSVVEDEAQKKRFGEAQVLNDEIIDAIETLREQMDFDNLMSKVDYAPNAMSFKSWAKARLNEGHGDYFDRANIFHGRTTVVKKKK